MNILIRKNFFQYLFFFISTLFLLIRPVHSFNLFPDASEREKNLNRSKDFWVFPPEITRAIKDVVTPLIRDPVHEEITNRIFGCLKEDCDNPDPKTNNSGLDWVMVGVRWNDDPPFKLNYTNTSACPTDNKNISLSTHPACWGILFHDAKKQAKGRIYTPNFDLIMQRSHFGDLQFFHAMASTDGERAFETKIKIMLWAEFLWNVMTQDLEPATKLNSINIAGFDFFEKKNWTIQDLFMISYKASHIKKDNLSDIAFGSLLHMIQDSFSESHVIRNDSQLGAQCSGNLPKPGTIVKFLSYQNQDHDEHAEHDSRKALHYHLQKEQQVNVVTIGQELLKFYEFSEPRKSKKWTEVKPFIDCIFDLENPQEVASAGDGKLAEK
ncbi:MAG: hypothetical protein HRU78_14595 [Gammaproteobacteria bacterium]|nr:MAG: hypothetical protein HRU78_14595 [Gammaproteobacteria bacterium]